VHFRLFLTNQLSDDFDDFSEFSIELTIESLGLSREEMTIDTENFDKKGVESQRRVKNLVDSGGCCRDDGSHELSSVDQSQTFFLHEMNFLKTQFINDLLSWFVCI